MKRYHKWSIYRNVIMLRYLFRGCDGLRQHVQMMRWIHNKGLTEVFDFIEEHFEETWTMPYLQDGSDCHQTSDGRR